MNFLAHLFLSCNNDQLMVGNFIADSISNRDIPHLPKGIQDGIVLHRKIDSYTDAHPKVREGNKLLHAKHRKYAPVLIDIYFDFFLSRHWNNYSEVSQQDFCNKAYEVLQTNLTFMPAGLKRNLPLMIADNWLMNYGTKEGIAFTFERMSRRVSVPGLVKGAADTLFEFETEMETIFLSFFPDVLKYVSNECPC